MQCQQRRQRGQSLPDREQRHWSALLLQQSRWWIRAPTPAWSPDSDLYSSGASGRSYAPAGLVPGVNTEFADGQPNVRRDGLEVFFFSNRTGTIGGNDIYASTRATTRDVWSEPMNLGPAVNSIASETRPSLSWDGTTLYFGSTRIGGTTEGSTDIYFTTR
ncbi:MAG: hypothetical protein LC739_06830 [Actinobacteria bacterium]|nr:hypothetical protein [Actinomycetota bacterium]